MNSSVGSLEQHGEFIAADARDEAAVAERALEALRDFAQQAIANLVSERVVDLLEAAQVEHQQSDARRSGSRSRARFRDGRAARRDWATR